MAVVLKLTTNLGTPGWTTMVVGVPAIVLAQTISLVTATGLMVLSGRRSRDHSGRGITGTHNPLQTRVDNFLIERGSTWRSGDSR